MEPSETSHHCDVWLWLIFDVSCNIASHLWRVMYDCESSVTCHVLLRVICDLSCIIASHLWRVMYYCDYSCIMIYASLLMIIKCAWRNTLQLCSAVTSYSNKWTIKVTILYYYDKLCIVTNYVSSCIIITKYKISKSHYNCKFITTKRVPSWLIMDHFNLSFVTFRCVARHPLEMHQTSMWLICGSDANQSHDNQAKIQPNLWMKYAMLL